MYIVVAAEHTLLVVVEVVKLVNNGTERLEVNDGKAIDNDEEFVLVGDGVENKVDEEEKGGEFNGTDEITAFEDSDESNESDDSHDVLELDALYDEPDVDVLDDMVVFIDVEELESGSEDEAGVDEDVGVDEVDDSDSEDENGADEGGVEELDDGTTTDEVAMFSEVEEFKVDVLHVKIGITAFDTVIVVVVVLSE